MRLKSLTATNHRIKTTCVANIIMLCLLSSQVWSLASINKHNRFVRQLNDDKVAVNYEDFLATNPYHQPHFIGNRSVIVQLFEWKFVDIAKECRDFLGPQGYAGVQLSPVLEHTVIKTDDLNHPWWERVEVVSYRLASRSGDETDFWSMSRICNEHGVRIYADVVLNHMAAPLHYLGITEQQEKDAFIVNTLLETNVNLTLLNYSHVAYTDNDFHKPTCMMLANTRDAHVIRNCQLNGHPDLDHSRGNVQKHIVEMLNKFIDMGVAGFRIDTAKYMWPIDLKNIFKQVKNLSTEFNFKKNTRPFVYYDVFDLGLDGVSKTEYSTYGVVSEYLYPTELSTILRRKVPLSSLINWGPALGFIHHEDSLVFIDSHDTQRGMPWQMGKNKMLNYKQRNEYIMANVFMLVHPYGAIKRIMSSYYFPNTDLNQGPPLEETNEDEIRSPKYDERNQCTKDCGWVCEHRWPQMVNLIKVANYFRAAGNKEKSIIYFQTNGPNQVAFCRGRKAFVAINNEVESDFIKEVYACLEPGLYCDMVTGGKKDGLEECHGKMLQINDQGYIKLELNVADNQRDETEEGVENEEDDEEQESSEIPSYGIVVIYVESKIRPTEQNEGDQLEAQEEKSQENEEAEQAEQIDETDNEEATEKQDDHEEVVDKENGEEEDEEPLSHLDNEEEEEIGNGQQTSLETHESQEGIKETKEDNENEQQNEIDETEIKEESLEQEEAEDLVKAEEQREQKMGSESKEEPPSHNELNEKSAASSDTGNNQSRNLDKKNANEIEEQIEKPSAEIVDEVTDQITDTVTAKIQDIQKAGILSNRQEETSNG